jgi:hypothetical protein
LGSKAARIAWRNRTWQNNTTTGFSRADRDQ